MPFYLPTDNQWIKKTLTPSAVHCTLGIEAQIQGQITLQIHIKKINQWIKKITPSAGQRTL